MIFQFLIGRAFDEQHLMTESKMRLFGATNRAIREERMSKESILDFVAELRNASCHDSGGPKLRLVRIGTRIAKCKVFE